MRLVLAFMLVFLSTEALATGRLSLELRDYQGGDKIYPIVGLAINEKLFANLHFNSWIGYGQRPVEELGDKDWVAYRAGVEAYFGGLAVGGGLFQNLTTSAFDLDSFDVGGEMGAYVKGSYQLW
jgi:hypothetical protein